MLISPTWVKTKYMYVCTEIKYVEENFELPVLSHHICLYFSWLLSIEANTAVLIFF